MEKKNKVTVGLCFLTVVAWFHGVVSEVGQPITSLRNSTYYPMNLNQLSHTVLLPIYGDVFPVGYFWATIKIDAGRQVLSFNVGVDTGSALTYVAVTWCGDHLETPDLRSPGSGGLLGLGSSPTSIILQLKAHRIIKRNVIGHCLASKARSSPQPTSGYLFIGDDHPVPASVISWTPMSHSSWGHYSSRPAELIFAGRHTGIPIIAGLHLIFDSGSSYTYFNTHAYERIVPLVNQHFIRETPLRVVPREEDDTLPVCWKDLSGEDFRSYLDKRLNAYFHPFKLVFPNAQLLIPPINYLIMSDRRIVCLGILGGGEIGLGDMNIIGDISMLDKLVIYDNENNRIGWSNQAVECGRSSQL